MKTFRENAVSPVVGVMLMLVVTIIIAAVVSGFAGGLMGEGQQGGPTLAMDAKVINMGSWTGSGFFATVTSVSEPIATHDLRIVTSWTAANGGNPVPGGTTITANNRSNIAVLFNQSALIGTYVAPFGTGLGTGNGTETISGVDSKRDFSAPGQQFGNYSLMTGTTLTAFPCGAYDADSIGGSLSGTEGYGVPNSGRFAYSSGVAGTDAVTAVLGPGWEKLRIGDTVSFRMIYIPTGSVIFNKEIPVTEG
ncbi:MAG: type IV pilin [Methanospirillum sp.]|nr:type IV pilin [Methanospirillum sp.]